jgi:hypothetical protein
MANVTAAAIEYLARRDRRRFPEGDGKSMKAGWNPSNSERQSCCDVIRRPSGQRPWSLYNHCKTKKHVAKLFVVSVYELNKAIRFIEATAPEVLF